jgi:hypothetical protein
MSVVNLRRDIFVFMTLTNGGRRVDSMFPAIADQVALGSYTGSVTAALLYFVE